MTRRGTFPASSDTLTPLPVPSLTFSLVFLADPEREDILLRITSAYEAASCRQVSPPVFGPL